jgi:hypothetical protein
MRMLLPWWEWASARAALAMNPSGALSGTWLAVAPEQKQFRDLVAQIAQAMTDRGAQVDTMLVDCSAVSGDVLAGLLEFAYAGEPPTGVISLLGLNETSLPDRPAVSAGLSGTLELIRALDDAAIKTPLWVLTRDTVAAAPRLQAWGLGRVMDLEHPGSRGSLAGPSAEFGDRTSTLLCTVLAGCDDELTAAWSTEPAGSGPPPQHPREPAAASGGGPAASPGRG